MTLLRVRSCGSTNEHHEHVRNQIREKIKLEYEVRRLIAEYEQAKRDAIWEDVITIGGGALSGVAIYFTAGTTTHGLLRAILPLVLAVAGGGVKLAFDITDNLEYRKYVPDDFLASSEFQLRYYMEIHKKPD